MDPKRACRKAAVSLLIVLFAGLTGFAQGEIDRCIEIELQRVERLYDLLDRFAGQVWPGWDN